MSKNKKNRKGVVYSTNPDHDYSFHENEEDGTLPPQQQKLYVSIDRKQRKGKEVTLIEGYIGHTDDLKDLGKMLKSKCGVGGAVKDGEIMIQGNNRDNVVKLLLDAGYSQTKKKGG